MSLFRGNLLILQKWKARNTSRMKHLHMERFPIPSFILKMLPNGELLFYKQGFTAELNTGHPQRANRKTLKDN